MRAPAADFTRDELRVRYSVSCLALFTLLFVSCSPPSDRLPTAPVSGVVTLDGQPLEMGSVTFVPQDGSRRPATGRIQSDGSYRLGTYDDDDGALLGSPTSMSSPHVTATGAAPPPSPMFSG